jgi:hypothetical protein
LICEIASSFIRGGVLIDGFLAGRRPSSCHVD